MTLEPLVEWDGHAAQDEPPAADEPVQIVAVADAQWRRACGRAARKALGRRKVVGSGDLQVSGIAIHEVHAMSGTLGQHGFIGRVGGCACLRQRVAKHIDPKGLRRLREEDLVAGYRVDDEALGIASLDRVGRRQRRNRRTEPDCGIDRASDQVRRYQRPRRIVNHHDLRMLRHARERVRDGILPPLAAFDDLHRLMPAAQDASGTLVASSRGSATMRSAIRSLATNASTLRCGSAARQEKGTASAAPPGARRGPRPR